MLPFFVFGECACLGIQTSLKIGTLFSFIRLLYRFLAGHSSPFHEGGCIPERSYFSFVAPADVLLQQSCTVLKDCVKTLSVLRLCSLVTFVYVCTVLVLSLLIIFHHHVPP